MHRAAIAVVAIAIASPARADDTSASDKLRILYSTRFTFTDDGLPLVTVEIMGKRKEIRLRAKTGISVRPDGAGGSAVAVDGADSWVVTVENAQPAVIQQWTIVDTLGPDDATGIAAALARWKERGFEPRSFEIGTVFGTGGEVIDTREVRVAIDPVASGKGAARAAEHARRFGIKTSVHDELVRRPAGTIVARSGATMIRNPSVLWFAPNKVTDTITVADVPTNTGGSQLQTGIEDRRYWGSVYVTLDHDGSLLAANAVAEDKLLAGLVPAEMYPDAPAAALEAQAIAARSELLQKIGRRNLTDPFVLCSTQQCQVYGGAGKEDPRTTRAIDRTRGTVLLRNGGGLVDIRYSATCGGHTEDNDAIWGGEPDPSLRGRRDDAKAALSRVASVDERSESLGGGNPTGFAGRAGGNAPRGIDALLAEDPKAFWCGRVARARNKFRWTETVTVDELTARIAGELPELGRIKALAAKQRSASGRIQVLTVTGEKGAAEVAGDLRIRRLLGGLKSTLFEITRDGDRFVLRGAGFGHGVGMCQLGAIGMAEAGKSPAQILDHYYRGAHLHRLY